MLKVGGRPGQARSWLAAAQAERFLPADVHLPDLLVPGLLPPSRLRSQARAP